MNKMFTQPTGPVAKQTNKQAIARLLGLPVQAVQIINVNAALSSSAVIYDPISQNAFWLANATGTPTSWSVAAGILTLVTTTGTFTCPVIPSASYASIPDIRDYYPDSQSDWTTSFQKAIADGVSSIHLPQGDFYVGELDINAALNIIGAGTVGINKYGSRIVKPTDAAFALSFNGVGQSTRPMGGGLSNLHVVGATSSDSGLLVKATSWSYLQLINFALQNLAGWGLTLQDVMESTIDRFLLRRLGSDLTGAIQLKDYLDVVTSNVNNLRILNGTWAYNSGDWLQSTENSNVDLLWLENNKFEWDGTPISANENSHHVLNFKQIARAFIHKNGFTHFTDEHNKYAGILRMGSASYGPVQMSKTSLNQCAGNVWTIEGGTLISDDVMNQRGSVTTNMTYSNTSPRFQKLGSITNITSNGNVASIILPRRVTRRNFTSVHEMFSAVAGSFIADSDALAYGTTLQVPVSGLARYFQISKDLLKTTKLIKVTARVKNPNSVSTSITMIVDGTYNVPILYNQTDITANPIAANSDWIDVVWYLTPSELGAGQLRWSNTGSQSFLFDGVTLEEVSRITHSYSWAPGSIAANTNSVSPVQGFTRIGSLIKGFSAPMFNAPSTGLIASINTYSASGGFTVSLYNPSAAAITPTISVVYVNLELV